MGLRCDKEMVIHQFLFEIKVFERKHIFELRELLLNIGCIEKYSGDLGLFYTLIYLCKDNVVLHINFSEQYYIDIYSDKENIDEYIDILTKVFPKSKIMMHYLIREV